MDHRPPFGSFLVRSVVTLVIPQGYTLSIAGALAVAIHRFGYPGYVDAWAFVAGAVSAFVGLAVSARRSLTRNTVTVPTRLLALVNLVPLVVVLVAAGLIAVIPSPAIGFPVAGLVGAGGYVLLLSAFHWLVAPAGRSH